jgi:hypothetical protein
MIIGSNDSSLHMVPESVRCSHHFCRYEEEATLQRRRSWLQAQLREFSHVRLKLRLAPTLNITRVDANESVGPVGAYTLELR